MSFATVVGVVGKAVGYSKNNDASQKRTLASKLQQSLADNKAAAELRQQVRQSRLARGRILNASSQTGGSGSSAETSALNTIDTQVSNNNDMSFITRNISGRITNLLGSAAKDDSRASIFNEIGNQALSFGGK